MLVFKDAIVIMHKYLKNSAIFMMLLLFSADNASAKSGEPNGIKCNSDEIECLSEKILKNLHDNQLFIVGKVESGELKKYGETTGEIIIPEDSYFRRLQEIIINKMKDGEYKFDYFNEEENYKGHTATLHIIVTIDDISASIDAVVIDKKRYSEARNRYDTEEANEYKNRSKKYYIGQYVERAPERIPNPGNEPDWRPHQLDVHSNVVKGYDRITIRGNEAKLSKIEPRGPSRTPMSVLLYPGEYLLTGTTTYGYHDLEEKIVISGAGHIDLKFKKRKPEERSDSDDRVTDKGCPKECPELIFIPTEEYKPIQGRETNNPRLDAFLMSRYEITVGDFRQFVVDTGHESKVGKNSTWFDWSDWKEGKGYCHVKGDTIPGTEKPLRSIPSKFWGWHWEDPGFEQSEKHPVVCVSWNDAQAYIEWLSDKTGHNYRLPTEAEWVYAAKVTSAGKYSWGDSLPECDTNSDRGARFDDDDQCDHLGTAAVGSYYPNKLDLHDIHGNVAEWIEGCSDKNCVMRVVRGGSWRSSADGITIEAGGRGSQDAGYENVGFRVVRDAFPTIN